MGYILCFIYCSILVFIICFFVKELSKLSKNKKYFYIEDYIDLINFYIRFEKENLDNILELDLDTDYEYSLLKTEHVRKIQMLKNIKNIIKEETKWKKKN